MRLMGSPAPENTPERQPEPFVAAFRSAFHGTDVHMRVRAAAMRAARKLSIEDRLDAKLRR